MTTTRRQLSTDSSIADRKYGATISVAPGDRISSVYSYPLYLCMLGFFLLFVALLLVRTRTEIRRRRTAALAAREVRE